MIKLTLTVYVKLKAIGGASSKQEFYQCFKYKSILCDILKWKLSTTITKNIFDSQAKL